MAWDPSSIERLNIYLPSNLSVQIDDSRAWRRAINLTGRLGSDIRQAYADAVEEGPGIRLAEIIRSMMEHGDSSWAPLRPKTLERYKRKGWRADHPWYRTGLMHDNIGPQVEEFGRGRYYIGITQYMDYPMEDRGNDISRGMTVIQLAKMLEYGGGRNGTIPARPLFSRAFEQYGGMPQLKKDMVTYISRYLKRKGHPVTNVKV